MKLKPTRKRIGPSTKMKIARTDKPARRWLVAEYCGHDIYMGWHLYVRDNPGYRKRNSDGDWGWIRPHSTLGNVVELFAALGIVLKGDWSCLEDGCAEFVRRFPLKGRKVWGEPRGGVEVLEDRWGYLSLPRAKS